MQSFTIQPGSIIRKHRTKRESGQFILGQSTKFDEKNRGAQFFISFTRTTRACSPGLLSCSMFYFSPVETSCAGSDVESNGGCTANKLRTRTEELEDGEEVVREENRIDQGTIL